MQKLLKDIVSGWRRLYKNPAFSVPASLILALGIGANAAIFSVVHVVLLRQLPYRDSARIVSVDSPKGIALTGNRSEFLESSQVLHSVESIAAYHSLGVNFGSATNARRLVAAEVSVQFLKVMGLEPTLGRNFASDEDIPGKDRVVILSDRIWRSDFGDDPDALGSSIFINGDAYTIIGVLPREMNFPNDADVWVPTVFDAATHIREAGAFYIQVIARLRKSVALGQAQAEFLDRAKQLVIPGAKLSNDRRPHLTPLVSRLTAGIRPALLMLLGTVGFVLAIACVNVAGLTVVHLLKRHRELGIRVALGASRFQLLKQQCIEAVLLTLSGAVAGLMLAYFMLNLFYDRFWPSTLLSQFHGPSLNPAVLAYVGCIALAVAFISSLAPVWIISRQAPALTITRGEVGHPRQRLLRNGLVVLEVALAVVLLSGAGLMIRTMRNLHKISLGYDSHNLLTFSVSLKGQPYAGPGRHSLQSEAIKRFYAAALAKLKALPDAVNAGAVSNLPLDEGATVLLPLSPDGDPSRSVMAELHVTTPGYFKTLKMPILGGKPFSRHDASGNQRTVILSRDVSQQLWPDENPIGQYLRCPALGTDSLVVLGIVGSSRLHELREQDTLADFYLSSNQLAWPSMTFVLRTRHNPEFSVEMARQALRSVDKSQPIFHVRTMEAVIAERESLERLERSGLVMFAVLAVMLAAMGLYGTISYSVIRRNGEIAIRMALGASRAHTVMLVLHEALWIVLSGCLAGIAASFYLTHFIASVLFGVSPHDPLTLAAVTASFVGIALLSSYLPARKAAFTDPIKALRMDC